MGNMDGRKAETWFNAVKAELGLSKLGFDITPTSPSICLGDKILICEKDLHYPWFTKQVILHEISHHLVPIDKTHGTAFHKVYAGLVSQFLAGYRKPGELLTPAEIRKTLFDLRVRETFLGRKVTAVKRYNALLKAQLDKGGE
jgi:hypothetical protein